MFPVHLNLGFRVFYFYEGFYFLCAIGAAFLFAMARLKRAGLDREVFADSVLWILLGAIAVARIFHFLFWDFAALRADPLVFFRVWEGGLTITGGLVGGVLAAVVCFRLYKVDFWAYAAAVSPGVLLGQAVGRVGCFLNGDAWGIPTRLPWGIAQPRFGLLVPGFRPEPRMASAAWEWCAARGLVAPDSLATVPLHPTQLYECLGDLLLAGLVILRVRGLARARRPLQPGLWLHLGGYALLRFFLEFLHGDREELFWAGLTTLQLVLAAFALLGAGLYFRTSARRA